LGLSQAADREADACGQSAGEGAADSDALPRNSLDAANRQTPPKLKSADPARGSEFNVMQLCEMEGEKITTMSARLKVLSAARFVRRRRVGQTIVYTIADADVLNLVDNAISHACEPPRPHPRTEPKEKISCRIISPTPNTPSSRPEVQPPRREARRPCRLHA